MLAPTQCDATTKLRDSEEESWMILSHQVKRCSSASGILMKLVVHQETPGTGRKADDGSDRIFHNMPLEPERTLWLRP